MSKRKGSCAFCSHHGKLTGEHVYPEWITNSGLLDLPRANSHHFHQIIRPGINSFGLGGILTRQKISGDQGSRKLYVVCAKCNNEWMSELQEAAKPLISKLILGQWPKGIELARNIVVQWVLMTAMVCEYLDPASVAFTQDEREGLRKGEMPENLLAWIGRSPREDPARRSMHRSFRVALHGKPLPARATHAVTTLHIGEFIAQVMKTPVTDLDDSHKYYAIDRGLRLVHPIASPLLAIAPRVLPDATMEPLHKHLMDFFEETAGGLRTRLIYNHF